MSNGDTTSMTNRDSQTNGQNVFESNQAAASFRPLSIKGWLDWSGWLDHKSSKRFDKTFLSKLAVFFQNILSNIWIQKHNLSTEYSPACILWSPLLLWLGLPSPGIGTCCNVLLKTLFFTCLHMQQLWSCNTIILDSICIYDLQIFDDESKISVIFYVLNDQLAYHILYDNMVPCSIQIDVLDIERTEKLKWRRDWNTPPPPQKKLKKKS